MLERNRPFFTRFEVFSVLDVFNVVFNHVFAGSEVFFVNYGLFIFIFFVKYVDRWANTR